MGGSSEPHRRVPPRSTVSAITQHNLQQEWAKMETAASVHQLQRICSISSVYGFAGKPKHSKNEPQIKNIGGETINKFNREMRIWEGYVVRIKERVYCFVCNWGTHSKPIAQRTKIHTNGYQIKGKLKQRETGLCMCPCVRECEGVSVCGRAHMRVLGKLLLLI